MLLKVTEDICLFTPLKLGNQTYNPQLKDKHKDKIRKVGSRPEFKGGYIGKTNGKLSKDYDKITNQVIFVLKNYTLTLENGTKVFLFYLDGELVKEATINPISDRIEMRSKIHPRDFTQKDMLLDFNIGSTLAVNKYNKREKEESANA